jgi:DNA-binding response OmpR family regulator
MATVLIVEDDLDVCETYIDVLENEEHDVHAITTSTQAIDCLVRRRMKPDLVILDMNLAGESGLIVLGLIRRIPRLTNTKVVIASGYPDLAKKAVDDWGADLFLQKPVAMDALKRTVRNLATLGGVEGHSS